MLEDAERDEETRVTSSRLGMRGAPRIAKYLVHAPPADEPRQAPSPRRSAGTESVSFYSFGPQVVGLTQRLYTGWLGSGDAVRYAPHTARGLTLPAKRALILLVNGLAARRGAAARHMPASSPVTGGSGP